MRSPRPLSVDPDDARTLTSWIDDASVSTSMTRRASIVLLSGAGLGPTAIADRLRCSQQTVSTWRERYRRAGLAGLRDAPRSGRPATVDAATVIARTLEPCGPDAERWSTRRLAADLGISNTAVAAVWRGWGILPIGPSRIQLGCEPALTRPIGAVVGLHIEAPFRLVALLSDAAPEPTHLASTGVQVQRWLDLVERLDARPEQTTPDGPGPRAVTAFLRGLGESMPEHPGGHLGLVVDASAAETEPAVATVRRWARTRDGVTVHTVAASGLWARVACMAAMLATGSVAGRASAAALHAAVSGATGPRLTWLNVPAPGLPGVDACAPAAPHSIGR